MSPNYSIAIFTTLLLCFAFSSSMAAVRHREPASPSSDIDIEFVFDYSKRGQWLRAAVLGANDGLISIAALMMGVGSVRKDFITMILTGVAGMIAGACSMGIGEFVSVYSQYDVEMEQINRDVASGNCSERDAEVRKKGLPSPLQAAVASALSFSMGAVVPLLGAAFIKNYGLRLGVVIVVVTLALLGFGALGAVMGGSPIVKSCLRVLMGGWLAMAITFGLTKPFGSV
ncbi:hypothetical protein SLE2022_041430 [Rubroshorea leprosula]